MCLQQDVTEESKRDKLRSSEIEKGLHEQAEAERSVIKILMLGKFLWAW